MKDDVLQPLPPLDEAYLEETLLQLLAIPSPVGLTDAVVRYVAGRLDGLDEAVVVDEGAAVRPHHAHRGQTRPVIAPRRSGRSGADRLAHAAHP